MTAFVAEQSRRAPAALPAGPSLVGFSRYGTRTIPPLDGLRGTAALSLLAFHVYNTTSPNWASGSPPPIRWFVSNLGQNGVSCFFVLSAFLLGMPFLTSAVGLTGRVDLHRYARARVLRLFPAWWIVLGVMAILWKTWVFADPLALAQYITLQQNYNPRLAQHVLAQGWTLGVEISFYLLLPVVAWGVGRVVQRVSRIGLRAAALLVALAVTLGVTYLIEAYLVRHDHLAGIDRPWLRHSLAFYGDRFALGLLCAAIFIEMRRRSAFLNPGLLLSFGAAVFVVGVWANPVHREQYATAGSAAVLMTLAVGERTLLGRLFSSSPMRWLGRLSYGIYLWHLPLKYVGGRVGLFPGRTPWATVPCIIGLAVASTAIAYVSYVAIERPALGLVDRRRAKRAGG